MNSKKRKTMLSLVIGNERYLGKSKESCLIPQTPACDDISLKELTKQIEEE
jgi:hypothetical protein